MFRLKVSALCLTTLVFFSLLFVFVNGCRDSDVVSGCRIEKGVCFCGEGCKQHFPFKTKEDCHSAMIGQNDNSCAHEPCLNNGACIQTLTSHKRYRCKCVGTGFFGPICQYPCPTTPSPGPNFPYECIEI